MDGMTELVGKSDGALDLDGELDGLEEGSEDGSLDGFFDGEREGEREREGAGMVGSLDGDGEG